jgi:hypothetical protein
MILTHPRRPRAPEPFPIVSAIATAAAMAMVAAMLVI